MPELYSLHRLSISAPGEALFAALSTALPGLSRHLARQAVTAGLVKVDGAAVLQPKHLLGEGATRIECDLRHGIKAPLRARIHDAAPPAEKPFTIVYEDHSLVVVNKAVGILSAPQHQAGSMDPPERGHVPELLRRAFRKQGKDMRFIGVVHRLDKETSGCLVAAKNDAAHQSLTEQFAGREIRKIYLAIASGTLKKQKGTINVPLGRHPVYRQKMGIRERDGREAITDWLVLAPLPVGTLVQCTLHTGRTHQIRVHMKHLGHPLLGDEVYGKRAGFTRQMLHAWKLGFIHPRTGNPLDCIAPIPSDFIAAGVPADLK